MIRRTALWLRLGEWLLKRRWWLVALASSTILVFEFFESQGINFHFFFEAFFYALVLPFSTGIALTWLSASRSELAWAIYYRELKRNLDRQLYNAHSYDELADIFMQFIRAIMPLVGATLYKYDQPTNSYKTILNWFLKKDSVVSDSVVQSTSENCPLLSMIVENEGMAISSCRDLELNASLGASASFCTPFIFSNSGVAAARFSFARVPRLLASRIDYSRKLLR